MLGFFIGTACLIGLIRVARGGRCGGYHGRHGWHGRGGWPGHRYGGGPWSSWSRGRPGGFGERAALRWLFEHLDTTHGQEKVIIDAVEELRGPAKKARHELFSTGNELADAVRGEGFDHGRMAETWVRQDKTVETLRLGLTTALARIHEVLDERQRKLLAELLARRGAPDLI